MTMEEESMKKSIGKKLLAGIVTASMILGVPVSGYSQEEETQLVAVEAEESVDVTEAVLAGAGEETETAVPAAEVFEEEAVFNVSEEDTEAAAEDILVAAEADAEEGAPEDGILLEAAEEDEVLEAADDEKVREVSSVSELNNAIKQVADGYTIRLTQDISSAGTLNVDADNMMKETTTITIDVSNYTLSAYSIIVGTGKTLTMTASGGSYSGRLNANGGTVNLPTGMKLTNTVTNLYVRNGGTANVTGASIECSATTLGHAVEVAKGTLNLSAGSIKVINDDVKAILVADDSGAVVNMTGGNVEVNGSGTAVVMSNGSMTVTGGTIKNTSGQGVEVLGGTFTISKGTIESKGNALTLGKNAGKAAKIAVAGTQDTTKILSSDGYAIFEDLSDYKGNIQVSGGYLEGKTDEIKSTNKTKIVTVTTDAVGFGHEVNRKYLKDVNCRADTQNDKGVYIIRTLTASNSAAAYIRDGETFYTDTVQEAMDVITGETYSPKTGDTVKLFRDVTDESEVKVEINRTIDLNGHKLETKMTVEDCTVTVKNGTLQSYTNDYALVVSDDAVVTLESNLKVASPGANAIDVGKTASKTYKLTVKGSVSAENYAVCVNPGDCTVDFSSATLTSNAAKRSVLRVDKTATGAKITITNSTLTGKTGIYAAAGEITLSGSTVKATGDQEENPDPGTEGIGSTIWANKAKLTIKSGTFTSAKGNVLYLESPTAGSVVSAGTFKSGRSNWDAVAGTPATDMFTGGTYYPNTKNDMKAGVKTAEYALVGVTGGTFYVGKYKEVVPALYKANASATKLTVAAAAKSTLLYGFKAHAAILNLTVEDIDVLVGTDDTVTKNKGTLPKTANTEAWVFHNDLVKLTAAANKDATCTLPGVSADCYYCETLKKAYDDAGGQTENTTVITAPAKGHTWSAWNANGDRTCSVCGVKEHDDSKKQPAYQISGNPKKLKAKAAGGGKLTVSWKKPTKSKLKKIKGVQIQVATDSNFTNIVKTKKVKKTKTSFTFKKLKKGQKYYVRVRFYKGSQISKWSPVKNKKVK